VNEHRFYEPWSVYEFDYEDLLKEPAALVKNIAFLLGISCEPSAIIDEIDGLSNTSTHAYDKINLLHKQHCTRRVIGYYREILSPELIGNIENTFRDWMKRWGYL
jgi:hypothetical protein